MHGRSPLQHRCTNKEVYFFMNNLTTRKIVLGMLMALVLAFSVQGIADALTFTQPTTQALKKQVIFRLSCLGQSLQLVFP